MITYVKFAALLRFLGIFYTYLIDGMEVESHKLGHQEYLAYKMKPQIIMHSIDAIQSLKLRRLSDKDVGVFEKLVFDSKAQDRKSSGQMIVASVLYKRPFDCAFEVKIQMKFRVPKSIEIESLDWISNFLDVDSDKVASMSFSPCFLNLKQTFILLKQIGFVRQLAMNGNYQS